MTLHDEQHQPDDGLTHAMMLAALNQILAECGYDPVPDDDEPDRQAFHDFSPPGWHYCG